MEDLSQFAIAECDLVGPDEVGPALSRVPALQVGASEALPTSHFGISVPFPKVRANMVISLVLTFFVSAVSIDLVQLKCPKCQTFYRNLMNILTV